MSTHCLTELSGTRTVYRDRLAFPTGLRMVQFCHGWPGTSAQFASLAAIMKALIESGRYVPFAGEQGGTNKWGDSTVAPAIEADNAAIVARDAARSTKFALVGYSMGFLNATAEIIANPTKVPVVIGVAPATNGAHIKTDAGGQCATDMDTAAGGTWSTVDAARSPASQTSIFTANSIRVECWQGTSDTFVRPADTSSFCTAVGGTYHAVAGDHSSVWTNVVAADVLAALDAGNWT